MISAITMFTARKGRLYEEYYEKKYNEMENFKVQYYCNTWFYDLDHHCIQYCYSTLHRE